MFGKFPNDQFEKLLFEKICKIRCFGKLKKILFKCCHFEKKIIFSSKREKKIFLSSSVLNQKQYFIVIRLKGKTKIREVKKKKSASWCTNKLLNLEKVTLSAFRDVNVFILLKNYHLALKTTAKKTKTKKSFFKTIVL